MLDRSPGSLETAWRFTQLTLRSGSELSNLAHGRLHHLAGRLAYVLDRFHEVRPHLEAARDLLSAANDDDGARLADIDTGLVTTMETLADPAGVPAAEAALAAAEARGDTHALAVMLADLANIFCEWGRTDEAYAMLRRAQAISGDGFTLGAHVLARTVNIPVHAGDPRRALANGRSILAQPETVVPNALIEVFVYSGWAYAQLGDFAAAREHIGRGLDLVRSARPFHEGYAQLAAADTERRADRPAAERRCLRACLRFGLTSLDLRSAVRAVWLSALLAEQQRYADAAQLVHASLVTRQLTGLPAWPLDETVFERWRADLQLTDQTGADRHETLIEPIEQALTFVEQHLSQIGQPGCRDQLTLDCLSRAGPEANSSTSRTPSA